MSRERGAHLSALDDGSQAFASHDLRNGLQGNRRYTLQNLARTVREAHGPPPPPPFSLFYSVAGESSTFMRFGSERAEFFVTLGSIWYFSSIHRYHEVPRRTHTSDCRIL